VRYTTIVFLGLPFLQVLVSGPRIRSLNLLSVWESKERRAEWVFFVLLLFNPCCLTGIYGLLAYSPIKTPRCTWSLLLGILTAATSAGRGDRNSFQSSYLEVKRLNNQKTITSNLGLFYWNLKITRADEIHQNIMHPLCETRTNHTNDHFHHDC